jgi:uncharacterized protein
MSSTSHSPDLTRREFVQIGAGVAAVIATRTAWSTVATPARDFEHGNPLSEFGYGDVQFAPGLHQAQLEQTHNILVQMNEDSLLRPFRMAAGLPAPGSDLGGWYSAIPALVTTGPTGPETFGQWLSALSRCYAATADEASRLKVQRLVQGYAETLEPNGKFFELSGSPTYFYDKLICGLQDAYQFAEVKLALGLISITTAAAQSHLAGKAIDQLGPDGDRSSESYTVPENQFIAWQRGAGPQQLEMAKQYLADFYFEPLARGENVLARRHAYSHVNALCSAAKAYLVLGDEKYLRAAANGLAFVEKQSFVTGGWGPSETFLPRPAEDYTDPKTGETKHYPAINTLGDSIEHEPYHFETPCGSYAHLKLTRYLLRITKDAQYGDSMERVMYNTVLGVLPLNKFGKAFYHSNYQHHAHKAYFDGYDNNMPNEWPCCSGTLPQVAADYRIGTYFRDQGGVFVNLYIPSTLRWEQHDTQLSLTQSGKFPLDDHIALEMTASKPVKSSIRLRMPAWTDGASVSVNGKRLSEPAKSGTFLAISREWRTGDRIDVELPRRLVLKAVDPQHPDRVALVCGPLVLFALSDDTPRVTRAELLSAKQPQAGSGEWHVHTAGGNLRLSPFWVVKDETYFTYLTV